MIRGTRTRPAALALLGDRFSTQYAKSVHGFTDYGQRRCPGQQLTAVQAQGDFPADAGLPVPQIGVEPSPLFDELFSYRPATGRAADDLVKTTELQELRKTLLGADVDDLPKPTAQPMTLAQRTAEVVSKSVDRVFAKVQYINAKAPKRKARIKEIVGETKRVLQSKGYKADWDGWQQLEKHCDEVIISTLMTVE